MALVKFSRKEFEKHIQINKEIKEKIALLGTPLEKLTDGEVEIEIFPNRPDLLSLQGYLRAFKSFLGKETGLKEYKINKPGKDYKVAIDDSVKNIRPYTACAIVKNIDFTEERIKEIIELQEKLHTTIGRNRKRLAIGIYPLEKIKLPIKYLTKQSEDIKFIPLESTKEMTGSQILKKHPTGRNFAHLLENTDKYPVFIDSNNKILSMPPIINSADTGRVTESTKEVFIECSGSDKEILKKTLNIIVTTLADMGGKIYQMELDYNREIETTPDLKPEKMKISLEKINNILGLNLKEKELSKLLSQMGYDYSDNKVSIPAWRTDILHEVDIAEDVAIAYGYDKLIPEMPRSFSMGEESLSAKLNSKIAEILVGLGIIEISSYHLIKQEEAKLIKLERIIELEDSKTEYKILRSNLLIPALRIFSENKRNEYPQKIFEIGTVFSHDEKEETGIKETENLIIASSPSNFTEIKQILDYLFKMLDIQYYLKEITKKELIEGRTAQIIMNDKPIGYLGDVHPKTLKDWNIKMPVSILEISLEEIFNSLKP